MVFPRRNSGLPDRPPGLPGKERTCYAGYSVVKVRGNPDKDYQAKSLRIDTKIERSSGSAVAIHSCIAFTCFGVRCFLLT